MTYDSAVRLAVEAISETCTADHACSKAHTAEAKAVIDVLIKAGALRIQAPGDAG